MKFGNTILAVALLLGCAVLSAQSADEAFDNLYNGLKQNGTEVNKFVSGNTRILFLNYPLQISSSSVKYDFDKGKKEMIDKFLRGTVDEKLIKRGNIILIYNYITTDRKIYSIVVTKDDF